MPAENPYTVLGLDESADDAAIRASYLRLVREFPPERGGAAFERIRDAYDALRDPRRRAQSMLRGGRLASLTELVDGQRERRFVGPQPWLDVIGSKRPRP